MKRGECEAWNQSSPEHIYEVRPRKDRRGFDLISDVLPFGRLWYGDANAVANAIGYAEHYSRSHDAVIRVYDDAGNVIETRYAARFRTENLAVEEKPRFVALVTVKERVGFGEI
jgi:hypothetical protein